MGLIPSMSTPHNRNCPLLFGTSDPEVARVVVIPDEDHVGNDCCTTGSHFGFGSSGCR